MLRYRMKRFLHTFFTVALLLVASIYANGQMFDPVRWSVSIKEVGDDEYELKFHAEIEEGWHVYSQDNPQDETGGGEPTAFVFDTTDAFKRIGLTIESGNRHEEYDSVFEMIQIYFENRMLCARLSVHLFGHALTFPAKSVML